MFWSNFRIRDGIHNALRRRLWGTGIGFDAAVSDGSTPRAGLPENRRKSDQGMLWRSLSRP